VSTLKAQDTHYWTQQFGTRSALMSGAVVAGANDNSMVYYNPGALGFLEDGNISINANLYQIENIRIENAIGQQTEFKSSQLGSVPILISGMLNRKSSKWKIGYGIMSPVAFQFKGTARLDGSYEIIDDEESPGLEEFVGELSKNTKVTEIMGALGFSRALTENFSIGFTNLITMRSESFTRNFLVYYFLNDPGSTLVSGTDIENIKYYNVRYQLKFGGAWKLENDWEIGATVTTPSINLFGNGTVAVNLSLNNTKLFSDERDDFLATDRQEKLKSTFKSPFSFAIGINKHFRESTFAFTAQLFSGIAEYNIMEPESTAFVRPSDVYEEFTADEFLTVTTRARAVVNVALAYEKRINDMLTINVSARTDNSYFEDESRASVTTVSDWDLYHVTGGVNLEKERSMLTIGLIGSFGKNDEYLQDGNLDNPDDNLLLGGALQLAESRYSAIGILLGFTYRFQKFN
jgi:hypothetical protein